VTIDPAELKARLARFPRVKLAHVPTPLEACPRLSAALGGPSIHVKRDDLTGLAFGGNKTRQLEFVFGAAVSSGADTIVAGAYTQSNWCRQITAACRKFGIDPVLVLAHGVKGPAVQGNLMLDLLMGADVTVLPVLDEELQPYLERRAAELEAQGRKPFLVSSFEVGTQSLAALAYVEAVAEICEQLGRAPDYIYVAGSEMSPAGLIVGAKALGLPTRVVSVSPIAYPEPRRDEIARICNAVAARLELGLTFDPDALEIDDDHVGTYGIPTEKSLEALHLAARTEGLILDPVYTSKGMGGLIDHIRRGLVPAEASVVFVHTGGVPALFAYAGDLGLAAPRMAEP
jgi:1-aminocyclopropane-1-carboxylate deaminase/D-cysteine desulfhydrase-like pyridoxal-dependent ACC family enzyme